MNSSRIAEFRRTVWAYYKKNGRNNLPWRKTKDPYCILVSEVMLQQTQVPRVIEKYKEFLKKFPNVRALAGASLSDVLKVWGGLGYNRRAKYLYDAAKEILGKHKGYVPRDFAALRVLSGIGPYTASAVRVFAFDQPDILIETNIRTAFIHHFYSSVLQKTAIADAQIIQLAQRAAKGQDPRKWHWALMDYGAYLKRSGVRNNHRSVHYIKQSKFEGSLRQVRGAILRILAAGAKTQKALIPLIRPNGRMIGKALASLMRDGLIVKEKGKWRIV